MNSTILCDEEATEWPKGFASIAELMVLDECVINLLPLNIIYLLATFAHFGVMAVFFNVFVIKGDKSFRMGCCLAQACAMFIYCILKLASNSRAMLGHDPAVTITYMFISIFSCLVSYEHGYSIAKTSIVAGFSGAMDQQEQIKKLQVTTLIIFVIHLICVFSMMSLLGFKFNEDNADTIHFIGATTMCSTLVVTCSFNGWISSMLTKLLKKIEALGGVASESTAVTNLKRYQKKELPGIFFGCFVGFLVSVIPYTYKYGLTYYLAVIILITAGPFFQQGMERSNFLKEKAKLKPLQMDATETTKPGSEKPSTTFP